MSVQDDLGLSEREWQQIDDDLKKKLIKGQADLVAMRQLLGNHALEDDDRDIRKRVKRTEDQLLGRDANTCDDTPNENEPMGDSRITIFGDVHGDKALEMLNQNEQNVHSKNPTNGNRDRWLKSLLTGAALVGGTALATYGLTKLTTPQPQPGFDPNIYSIEAVP